MNVYVVTRTVSVGFTEETDTRVLGVHGTEAEASAEIAKDIAERYARGRSASIMDYDIHKRALPAQRSSSQSRA